MTHAERKIEKLKAAARDLLEAMPINDERIEYCSACAAGVCDQMKALREALEECQKN
jgi:hypothetical protein